MASSMPPVAALPAPGSEEQLFLLAARIASQYQGAPDALQKASLAYLGVILLLFAVLVNVIARIIVQRGTLKDEPVTPDVDALATEAEGL